MAVLCKWSVACLCHRFVDDSFQELFYFFLSFISSCFHVRVHSLISFYSFFLFFFYSYQFPYILLFNRPFASPNPPFCLDWNCVVVGWCCFWTHTNAHEHDLLSTPSFHVQLLYYLWSSTSSVLAQMIESWAKQTDGGYGVAFTRSTAGRSTATVFETTASSSIYRMLYHRQNLLSSTLASLIWMLTVSPPLSVFFFHFFFLPILSLSSTQSGLSDIFCFCWTGFSNSCLHAEFLSLWLFGWAESCFWLG